MRLALGAAALVVLGVGVFSVVMQPTNAERIGMGLIFGLMAIGAAGAAVWLPRLAKGNRSLRTTVTTLSVVSFLIVAVGMVAAGQQMFISTHDLTVLLIVVGFGVVAAVAFAVLVSGPLTGDLTIIAATASGIASGDLTRRTRVTRADEVGDLAAAVDGMRSGWSIEFWLANNAAMWNTIDGSSMNTLFRATSSRTLPCTNRTDDSEGRFQR